MSGSLVGPWRPALARRLDGQGHVLHRWQRGRTDVMARWVSLAQRGSFWYAVVTPDDDDAPDAFIPLDAETMIDGVSALEWGL